MLDRVENENQEKMILEEVRQSQLGELEASEQMIGELSNEVLETVTGGALFSYPIAGAMAATAGVVGYDIGSHKTDPTSKNLTTVGTVAAVGAGVGLVAVAAKKVLTPKIPFRK